MQPEKRRFDHRGVEIGLPVSSSEESSSEEYVNEMSMDMKNKLYMMAMMGQPSPKSITAEQQIRTALSTKFPEINALTSSLQQQKRPPPLMALRDLPSLTSDPVDQSIFKPTNTKGLQTALPNSKLVKLTPSDYAKQSLLTTTTTASWKPTTLQAMGLGELALHNCKNGHNYKKKTEPRILAPFNTALGCTPCGGGETQQQKNERLRRAHTGAPPQLTPLSEQEKKTFTSSPLTFSMDATKVDRLTTQFSFIDRLGAKGGTNAKAFQSLYKTGQAMNLSCAPDYCNAATVKDHLKCAHPEFYHLLAVNGLVGLLDLDPVLIAVVPDRDALAALPQSGDKATADQLRYHIIRPGAVTFQEVTSVAAYDTLLPGKQVQVERHAGDSDDSRPRNAYHTINGQVLRSDPVSQFIYSIYHIRGGLLLRPDDAMPVQEEAGETTGDEKEGGETNSPDEETTDTASDNMTSETEGNTGSFMLRHVTHGTNIEYKKKSLGVIVERMSQGYYSGRLSLTACPLASVVQPEQKTNNVCITLACFNTDRLFADYRANRLNEMARVASTHFFKVTFPGGEQKTQTHVKYDAQTHFTEYEYNTMVSPVLVSHAKLAQGVLAISFNSPYDGAKHTVALCRLETPSSNNNNSEKKPTTSSTVFMSQDENIILRFTADVLRTVCINHRALSDKNLGKSFAVAPLEKEHFLEFATAKHENALYYNILDKKAFDELLMTHGVAKKFVKKARRFVGKAASRGKRELGKATSGTLQQVDATVLDTIGFSEALDALDTKERGTWAPETLSLMQYGASHKVRSSIRPSQLSLKKYELQVGKESVLVYLPVDTGNKIGSDYGATGLTKYVDFNLSDHPDTHLNVSHMPANKASRVFYVTAGGDLLVLRFAEDGSLSGIYAMPKRFDLANRLMQARVK